MSSFYQNDLVSAVRKYQLLIISKSPNIGLESQVDTPTFSSLPDVSFGGFQEQAGPGSGGWDAVSAN